MGTLILSITEEEPAQALEVGFQLSVREFQESLVARVSSGMCVCQWAVGQSGE